MSKERIQNTIPAICFYLTEQLRNFCGMNYIIKKTELTDDDTNELQRLFTDATQNCEIFLNGEYQAIAEAVKGLLV